MSRAVSTTTCKEAGCHKAYSRTLPVVEAVEDAERHAAMLSATNPANADLEHHICPACEETDSIESIHHVLLHCPAYEQRRTALRTAVACLPAAQASAPVLNDGEGVVALLRDDFMGGAEEAATAVDTFLHAIMTFRNHCVEGAVWG